MTTGRINQVPIVQEPQGGARERHPHGPKQQQRRCFR